MHQQLRTEVGTNFSRRTFLQGAAGVTVTALLGRNLFAAPNRANLLKPTDVEKKLIVHTPSPHNAEPALGDLADAWLTPLERFFVRSHAPDVPQIDAATFRVSVEGMVERSLQLSIRELQQLPQTSVTATLTCAGNRRAEYNAIREVAGVQWREGAIGNANWQGVRLSEILKQAGIKDGARHVWFESVDQINDSAGGTFGFGGSIPIEKALADQKDTPGALVTLKMNDAPLAADHGFPVRMVVPGYIGARSVKWLGRIVVSDRPSPNHYLAGAYRLVTEDTELAWTEAGPIYNFLLNSAICEPAASSSVKAGKTTVRGYALPPGNGQTISKVEVSTDAGRNWHESRITSENVPYCWVLWESQVPLTSGTSELIVRATDSAGLLQPQVVPWNLKGYLNNAWHHVPVKVAS